MFDQIDGQDPVPTSVRVGPDGAVHVGLLALAAGPGAAKVVRIGDDGTPVDYATGLTSVVGIDFDSAGNLYAAEVFGGDEGVGRLVKVTPEGEQSAIGEGRWSSPAASPSGTTTRSTCRTPPS